MTLFPSRAGKSRFGARRGREDRNEVQIGATFARGSATQVMETACVLAIADHEGGIPHVRYNCTLHRADRVLEDGPRTLALPAFLARFERAL
jgi:hypothetical protein